MSRKGSGWLIFAGAALMMGAVELYGGRWTWGLATLAIAVWMIWQER